MAFQCDGVPVLRDGLTSGEWYKTLNSKVFFWPTEKRLEKMLEAKTYRNGRHIVLTVDTESLLKTHGDRVLLSPINSGNTQPYPQPRGKNTFLPLDEYPFECWRKKRRSDTEAIAELVVPCSVRDVRRHLICVEKRGADGFRQTIWKTPAGP